MQTFYGCLRFILHILNAKNPRATVKLRRYSSIRKEIVFAELYLNSSLGSLSGYTNVAVTFVRNELFLFVFNFTLDIAHAYEAQSNSFYCSDNVL